VPTAAEAGVANFDAPFYLVLFAPKGTPAAVMDTVSREFAAGLATPEVRERAAALDVVTLGGTPEETTRTLKDAAAKWAGVVQRIGLKLD